MPFYILPRYRMPRYYAVRNSIHLDTGFDGFTWIKNLCSYIKSAFIRVQWYGACATVVLFRRATLDAISFL